MPLGPAAIGRRASDVGLEAVARGRDRDGPVELVEAAGHGPDDPFPTRVASSDGVSPAPGEPARIDDDLDLSRVSADHLDPADAPRPGERGAHDELRGLAPRRGIAADDVERQDREIGRRDLLRLDLGALRKPSRALATAVPVSCSATCMSVPSSN